MNKYIPQPIDTSNVQLPRDLNTLMEELARSNHDTWAANRIKEGWTYGPRNDALKQNPCLVPYEDLPEAEKDYDRNTSGETLKSIYKLGFAITKRTEGQIMLVGGYSPEDINIFQSEASKYENKISYFSNWQAAKNILSHDLTKWNAIILDTNARLSPTEEQSPYFLRNVLDDLNSIFSRNRNEIPWFVVPNVYDDFTEALIRYTVGRDREKKDWGHVLYKKDSGVSELLYDISELLPSTRNYRIRCVYNEVFEVLEEYFPEKAKNVLFNILMPLHYPEVFYSFVATDYYNSLRKILESMFAVCCKYGIIPSDVCYSHDNNGSVNLRYSCDYLMYGKISGDKNTIGKGACSAAIARILDNILNIANEGSHMGEDYKTEGLYSSIMAYSLQLCDVLSWLGRYIKDNNCMSIEDAIRDYNGKEVVVEVDTNGNYYHEKCVLPKGFIEQNNLVGCKVRLYDVIINAAVTRKYYPLFAKTRKI